MTRISDQSLDEDEIVAFLVFHLRSTGHGYDGKITDAKTIIGVLLHYMHSQGNA